MKHSWKELAAGAHWSEEQARWVLGELRRSGLSSARFSEKYGVHPKRLWYWRTRLDGKVGSRPAAKVVEVKLPSRGAAAVLAASGKIEIDLLSGRRLTVSEHTTLETLSALVALLELS